MKHLWYNDYILRVMYIYTKLKVANLMSKKFDVMQPKIRR